MQTKKWKVERTKSGIAALWELGGGATNTGEATIICDRFGRRKKAIYVRRKGHLSNSEHALIPVEIGDVIVKSFHKRGDFIHRIYSIENIDDFVTLKLNYEYSNEQWDKPLPEYLKPAVDASTAKAQTYHCREPFYIQD